LRPASLSSFPNTLSEFRQCEAWFNGPAKTRLAQVGIDLATRAAILGHSSIRIVQKYVHPTAEHKREAMRRYDQMLQAAEKKHSGRVA